MKFNYENPDLKKLYDDGERIAVIAKKLGWTVAKTTASLQRAWEAGTISYRSRALKWTPNKDAILRQHYGKLPNEEVAKMLGVPGNAIRGRAGRLKLAKPRRQWTHDDTEWLRASYAVKTIAEMSDESGWGKSMVSKMIKQLGLLGTQKEKRTPPNRPAKPLMRFDPDLDASTPVLSPHARDWRLDRTMDECAYLVDGKHQACCNPVMGGNTTLSKRYCAGHYARMVDWGRFKPIGPKKQEFYAAANTFRERTDHSVEARRQEVGKWG